jgi:hypothetical protein
MPHLLLRHPHDEQELTAVAVRRMSQQIPQQLPAEVVPDREQEQLSNVPTTHFLVSLCGCSCQPLKPKRRQILVKSFVLHVSMVSPGDGLAAMGRRHSSVASRS